jgi:hypothetical protein
MVLAAAGFYLCHDTAAPKQSVMTSSQFSLSLINVITDPKRSEVQHT